MLPGMKSSSHIKSNILTLFFIYLTSMLQDFSAHAKQHVNTSALGFKAEDSFGREVQIFSPEQIEDRNFVNSLPSTVTFIKVQGPLAHPEALAALSRFQQLEVLDLSFTGISDLRMIPFFPHLLTLSLVANWVSDLRPLGRFSTLQSLYLCGCQATSIAPLTQLRKLTELSLQGCRMTDISPLGVLEGLEFIDLAFTAVTDLSPLTHLHHLKQVSLLRVGGPDLDGGITAQLEEQIRQIQEASPGVSILR
jgi:Leucine-rich repeat (LRR) protein